MKVTYNWLKDFVDIRVSPERLAQKLTMAGLEVTSQEERGGDVVFELEITSNRPDWLSVIGIAREVAAITGKKMRLDTRKNKNRAPIIEDIKLKIDIESKKDCPFYTAKVIRGIQVKPSPGWLKKRLALAGLRSVNNIVDITNYLLIETGQPLHAFDLDKITGDAIFVRRAKESERITLIDAEERILNKEILVIADSKNPIAVAGIMGGKNSEISGNTRAILLEAAVFNPIITRRASRMLKVSSESSYLFERGVDLQNVEFVSTRAANLILELSGGEFVFNKSTPKPEVKKKIIVFGAREVNRVLGAEYTPAAINKILTSLSFSIKRQGKEFKILSPSFRMDIKQPIDVIEEIARIAGYDNIPARLPRIIPQARIPSTGNRVRLIKDILISQGVTEVVTYSLISKSMAYDFGYNDSQLVSIVNPLSNQQEVLRPSVIPGLVSCIAYNLNQRQKNVRIFEACNNFNLNRERLCLNLAFSGGVNLLHVKGVLEIIVERLGFVCPEFIKMDAAHPFFQKEASLSLMINKIICASLGMIKPDILARLDIKGSVFAAELDLEILFAQAEKIQKRYIPIPLYPEAARDISIVLGKETPAGDIIKRIKSSQIPYLVALNLKDQYTGKHIPAGYKGLTFSCIYRANDHTLTAEEAEVSHQKVAGILKTDFSARQR
ncbi:MAG: phenylalanine--tRNA ligase subunit beta [Candidatus Omnitrophota bacterium]